MEKIAKHVATLFIVAAFTLSGCASKPVDPQEALTESMQVMRDAVTKHVTDAVRRNRLLGLTAKLEKTLLTYNQAYADFVTELGQLNRNYDTPRERLEYLITSFQVTRERSMNEVVKLHFDMVAQTSEDEWKRIVKHELEALKSVRELPEDKLGGKS